jgi:MFS transporter, PPP family, 3-phenylpropionic acid transporter
MCAKHQLAGSRKRQLSAIRVGVAYAFLRAGPDAIAPFAALWFRAKGAPLEDLGLLLALPLIGRVAAARPLAAWASRFSMPWTSVSLLCGFAAVAAFLGMLDWGTWPSVLAWWIVCFCASACTPLMDTAILGLAPIGGQGLLAYAHSCSVLAAIGAYFGIGFVFAHGGADSVLIWAGSTAGLAAAAIPTLMSISASQAPPDSVVLRKLPVDNEQQDNSSLVLVLAAAALIEASHGFNSIAMITWSARGYGPELSGALWATGSVADVVFLWFMGTARGRIGPARLLIAGGLGACVRWVGFATAPPLPALFALQALHALSFTATYLASVQLIGRLSDQHRGLSVQALNWGLSSGLCAGLGALSAGPLYTALGVRGYWVMTAVATLGLVLATDLQWRMQTQKRLNRAPAAL